MNVSSLTSSISLILFLSLLLSLVANARECPREDEAPSGGWWTEYAGSCYKFFNATQPWFPAEAACRLLGGHLASIRSDQENRLVGRLSGCRDVWIGRFAADFHRTADPDAYEWTDSGARDESSSIARTAGYSRHKFSASAEPHMGAIKAEGLAWYNEHYHELRPYICEVSARTTDSDTDVDRCQPPLVQFRDNCYWLSDFTASFVEASLHCERELGSHLASVHSREEREFVGTLELDADTCEMATVWLGLIKQNPCRPMKEAGSQLVCYQWTDFSGEHADYPQWVSGHPLLDDLTVNCVSLTGDGLRSEKCHSRLRFLCKRPRAADTKPGGGRQRGVVAMPTESPTEAATTTRAQTTEDATERVEEASGRGLQ